MTTAGTLAELRRLFEAPPDDSRVMMRWWWFGPSVTKPRLARELQLMKEGGIGGVEIQPVYPVALDDAAAGIKNLPFLSDEFLDALRFTSDTAQDLGLRVDLTLGSGWPFGGPTVPIAEAAGRLRHERLAIPSGASRVPLPDLANGERLVALFVARTAATPSPTASSAGGGATSGATTSGGPARARDGQLADKPLVPDSVRQIPIDVADGMIRLTTTTTSSSSDVLLVFIASRTGMMVKRAAVGAEGYVLDHYDRAALDRYLADVGDRLMKGFGPRPPFAIFCDSLEVFQSDWTGDLLPAFRQRRGYDLTPHLPALVADVGPQTAAIRHDWGQTLTELLHERFLAPMRDWSARHRTRFRVQGYGIPPATVSSNALADLPEGEGWQWRTLTSARWAASASHLYGRPVSSSETWTWLHSPSFRATPLDVKMEADLHFLQGVTQLIGHGWPYTADGVEDPGWRFYAAGVFNDRNPWWIVMPDVSRYLQRATFLLRQGAPANDVALYLPNSDAWASFSAGRVHMLEVLREHLGPHLLGDLLDAGVNLDFVDDDALRAVGKVEGNALMLGGNRYRAIVLPGVERMPIETLRTIDAFARGGGTVIATRRLPALAPGFRATDADHAQVRDLSQQIFSAAGARGRFVADERTVGPALAAALAGTGGPDVQFAPAAPEIGIVHRRMPFADLYFLANTANVSKRATGTFRVSRPHAAWWDPMTGRVTPVRLARGRGADATTATATAVAIELDAYASGFLVFTDEPSPPAAPGTPPATTASAPARTKAPATLATAATAVAGSRVPAIASRASGPVASASGASTLALDAGWRVTFASTPASGATPSSAATTSVPGPTGAASPRAASPGSSGPASGGGTASAAPMARTFDRLRSWTDEEATRDFSGTATYEREVTIPADFAKGGRAIWLDFGEATPVTPTQGRTVRQQAWVNAPVREAAVVYIDDRRVGALWAPPYALDVTPFLTPGSHRLRIVVGNLAINRMATRPLPSYRLLNLRYGVRFEPQDMENLQPLPSGLLGPVRVIAAASTPQAPATPSALAAPSAPSQPSARAAPATPASPPTRSQIANPDDALSSK